MPYYQVTNTSVSGYSSVSLTLGAGLSTVLNVPTLPIDLNDAIIDETLVVIKLGAGGGGGPGGDVVTDIIATNAAASLVSQELVIAQASRLAPGVEITNLTLGDIAIRASSSAASFAVGGFDEKLAPGETTCVAADYLGAIQAICEIASGIIRVRVFS